MRQLTAAIASSERGERFPSGAEILDECSLLARQTASKEVQVPKDATNSRGGSSGASRGGSPERAARESRTIGASISRPSSRHRALVPHSGPGGPRRIFRRVHRACTAHREVSGTGRPLERERYEQLGHSMAASVQHVSSRCGEGRNFCQRPD